MQQRVAIARALATNPSILLLDEPFGALDLQIRESMQDFLLKLWQRTGLTVLLITHDVEEALVLAQRVHVLAPNPGRIVRSIDVALDKHDLDQLRLSSDFLALRRSLSGTMRELEPSLCWTARGWTSSFCPDGCTAVRRCTDGTLVSTPTASGIRLQQLRVSGPVRPWRSRCWNSRCCSPGRKPANPGPFATAVPIAGSPFRPMPNRPRPVDGWSVRITAGPTTSMAPCSPRRGSRGLPPVLIAKPGGWANCLVESTGPWSGSPSPRNRFRSNSSWPWFTPPPPRPGAEPSSPAGWPDAAWPATGRSPTTTHSMTITSPLPIQRLCIASRDQSVITSITSVTTSICWKRSIRTEDSFRPLVCRHGPISSSGLMGGSPCWSFCRFRLGNARCSCVFSQRRERSTTLRPKPGWCTCWASWMKTKPWLSQPSADMSTTSSQAPPISSNNASCTGKRSTSISCRLRAWSGWSATRTPFRHWWPEHLPEAHRWTAAMACSRPVRTPAWSWRVDPTERTDPETAANNGDGHPEPQPIPVRRDGWPRDPGDDQHGHGCGQPGRPSPAPAQGPESWAVRSPHTNGLGQQSVAGAESVAAWRADARGQRGFYCDGFPASPLLAPLQCDRARLPESHPDRDQTNYRCRLSDWFSRAWELWLARDPDPTAPDDRKGSIAMTGCSHHPSRFPGSDAAETDLVGAAAQLLIQAQDRGGRYWPLSHRNPHAESIQGPDPGSRPNPRGSWKAVRRRSTAVGEKLRLYAEIDGFTEQLLLSAGIAPFLRQAKALLERGNQSSPPSIRIRNWIQYMTTIWRFIMRRLKDRLGAGSFSRRRSDALIPLADRDHPLKNSYRHQSPSD